LHEEHHLKNFLLATVAASTLALGAPATAADMAARPYTKAPAMVPTQIYNWTGFYIGGNAGYHFGDRTDIVTTGQAAANIGTVAAGLRNPLVNQNRDGFIGGVQMGYNWQASPNWVFGLEADIQYVDVNRTLNAFGTSGLANNFSSRIDYLGTARARLGYTWGATMLYATGGLAYAGVNNSASFFNGAGALAFFGEDRTIRTGYTVGGGIEHMFTPNWSIKGEYLYYDLGRSNLNVALVAPGLGVGTGYNTSIRNDGHIARVGLNYKFGGPMVGRY
jgi:outer membrane immunogenic protein